MPTAAHACGGMFCSTATAQNPAPAPVDQTAERIVFEVDPGTITAHVQIQYTGSADQFAWVVPVPNQPMVEESSLSFIQNLDVATTMNVQLPTVPTCEGAQAPVFSNGGGGGGCIGCSAEDSSGAENSPNQAPDPDADDPVTVYNQGFTSNYEFAIIGAEQASDLTEWLQMNGYNVSDNMIPVMQPYVDQEMVFLGLKLQDGKSASDIVPIAITYEDTQPMIPIQLTAVAAQPMMGILVFILADEFYSPANFDSIAPAADEILHDETGATNYFDWMARRAGQAEGKMWVQEFVGTAPSVSGVRHSQLSRYYARMSPEHMTVDPIFVAAPAQGQMAATLDLSSRPSMVCNDFSGTLPTIDERLPAECAWQFCGMSGECVVDDSNPGCICSGNTVAQTFQGPDGQPRITCVPAENPYGITAQAGGEGTEFDPCTNFECGAGTCQLKSGFPTCACDDGAAAFISSGLPRCREVATDAPTYGPGAGLESEGSTEPLDNGSGGGSASGDEDGDGSNTGMGALIPLGLGLGLLMALRRRREP